MRSPEFNLDDRPLAKRKAERFAAGRASPPAPPGAASEPRAAPEASAAPSAMVDVGAKPVVRREAAAAGFLRLAPATVAAIRERRVPKGDPVAVAEVAAIQAVKATPSLLPLCHPIPLTGVDVRLAVEDAGVRATVEVRADWKTGVEMEALAGVTIALLTVWDMTKALEKDADGQYPTTRLEDVRVLAKRKEAPA